VQRRLIRYGTPVTAAPRRRISVAMATYQGSRWVAEQLRSILSQTRPPDEIVVCDDASTDGTAEVARAVMDGCPVAARIVVNPTRLGATANFEQAIRATGGDIVVLADQDDIWHLTKLATVERAFAATPSPAAVFSDALLVDAEGRHSGATLWRRVALSRRDAARFARGHGVDVLLRHNVVTGATMAFDARLRDLVLPLPSTGYHDAWIALLASAVGPLLALDEPLVEYRLHDANTAGLPARTLAARIAARRRRARVHEQAGAFFEAALDRLHDRGAGEPRVVAALSAKVAHLRFRQQLARTPLRRLAPVLSHMARGDYARFSREGQRSGIYDILYG
jgi:glycosyltransferase involved in cell wall biosynthesis